MEIGARLDGRYELVEAIGQGVSAVVYAAHDRKLDRQVAVKVLNPHLRADEISVERFRREIQVTRHLDHPQIVSIFDLGQEGEGGEQIWLAMELLEGSDLKAYISLNRPIPVDRALDILSQLLGVLSACHAKNVIHRDLKPQNVFIDEQGRIKLLDFGISRMTTLRDLTQTGTSLGSPEYMAPELFASNVYDPRSDLYALGVLAFELLAGQLPFQGDSLPVLYHAHREREVPSLTALRKDVPDWLEQMVERLLAKRPHERYQSADEVRLDFESECVAARRLPEVAQRRCLACDMTTREDLPLCGSCGIDPDSLLRDGTLSLHCSQDVDPQQLAALVEEVLDADVVAPTSGQTLLLNGLDRIAAERIKAAATRRGIFTELRPALPVGTGRRIKSAAKTLLIGWVAIPALIAAGLVVSRAFLYSLGVDWGLLAWTGVQFFAAGGLAVSILGTPFRIAAAWRRSVPLVDRGSAVSRRVIRDSEWLVDLAPRLRAIDARSARTAAAGLVDKFARVVDSGSRFSNEETQKLRGLLEHGVELAGVISEIGHAFEDRELCELGQRYAALDADLARLGGIGDAGEAERAQLLAERQSVGERLRMLSRLDERRGLLENELTAVQSVFARLIARALVFEQHRDDADLRLLDESIERLRDDMAMSREIAKELRDL